MNFAIAKATANATTAMRMLERLGVMKGAEFNAVQFPVN